MRIPKTLWAVMLVAALALPAVLQTPATEAAGPTTLGRTDWQVTRPYGPVSTPYFPQHGHISFYNYIPGPVPAENSPGWANCGPGNPICPNASTIGMNQLSRLGGYGCLAAADFTFFQSFVSIPAGATITQFSVNMSGADDGARVAIYNSAHPTGYVFPGSYIYLGGAQSTTDLSAAMVAGEVNRVLITQVDDCYSGNNLQFAEIRLNGTTVPVQPSADFSLTKTGPASATVGSNITYNVNIVNPSANNSAGLTVTDILPPSLKFISATAPCTHDGAPSGGAVTCPGLTLAAGASATLAITVQALQTGTVVNSASITNLGGLLDPNPGNNQASASTNVTEPPAPPAPPFTIPGTLPTSSAKICLPPYMDQNLMTQYWWARADGGQPLSITLYGVGVNASEAGTVTMTVANPASTPIGTVSVVQPPTGEAPAPPVVAATPLSGDLYRIAVRVLPPASGPVARHYRLVLQGATLLGTNSTLQPQAEHEDVRWKVNVGAGEPLTVVALPAPEASLNTGSMSLIPPGGGAPALTVPLNAGGGTATIPSPAAGQWTVAMSGLDGHYLLQKVGGTDTGIYVGWDSAGAGSLTVTVLNSLGGPNTAPVTIELIAADGSVTPVPGVTNSFTWPKLATGAYAVRLAGDPGSVPVVITCEGEATATLTVPNKPPVAVNDSASTPEDTAVTIAVLGNDADPDGGTLSITSVTQGAHGSVVINGDGTVTYTPAPNWNGTDSFTYTISDGQGGSATATVSVTVTPVNDQPDAVDDSAGTNEDTPVTVNVTANDTDPDGDTLSVTGVTQGANGSVTFSGGSVTYTPAPNWYGTDSFTYTIVDGNGGTDTATVTITVASVNDAPVAVNDSASTPEDTAVTIAVLGNDADPDGGTLSITSVTQGAHGSVVINGDGTVTYTPAPNWNGTDSFTYTISDGQGGSATATVSVTVTPVNDQPDAVDDSAGTNEDTPVTVNVTANDTDPDGDTLSVTGVTQGTNGSVTFSGGSVTYTPAPNWYGTDSFTYTIVDGNGGTDTATVTITVASVNDAPVAVNDSASTNAGFPVTVSVLANDSDSDGGTLSVASTTAPANGSVAVNPGGSITYTPNPGFSGTDTFTYTVSDGQGGTATATVTITVIPVADASRMTGGGSIETGKGKDAKRSTWGFEIRCDGSRGNLEFQDHGGGNFHLEGIVSVNCVDDPAVGPGVPKAGFDTLRLRGVGRWNGTSGYTVEATIVDAGEPGTRDTISITVRTAGGAVVSTLSGTLTGGNHQAHK